MVFSLNQILNVSLNLHIAIYLKDQSSLSYFFSNDVEEHEFPLSQTWGKILLYSHLTFTAACSLKSENDWPVELSFFMSIFSIPVHCHSCQVSRICHESHGHLLKSHGILPNLTNFSL